MMHFERNAKLPGVVRIEVPETPTAVDDYTAGWLAAAQALSADYRGTPEAEQAHEESSEDGHHYNHVDKDTFWQQGGDGTADTVTPKPTSADIEITSQAGALCIRVAGEQAVRLQGDKPTYQFYALWQRHKALLKAAGIYLFKENGRWQVTVRS